MRIEILTRIGFEPRTQTPGTVLSVPGDATSLEAEDWLARGLARALEESLEDALADRLEEPQAAPQRPARRKERP